MVIGLDNYEVIGNKTYFCLILLANLFNIFNLLNICNLLNIYSLFNIFTLLNSLSFV